MDNRQQARRIFDQGWNKGEVDVIDEIVAPNSVINDAYITMFGAGPGGLKKMITTYRKAFSDLRLIVEQQIADGDFVVTRWTSIGTNDGDFMGNAATYKKGKITGITIHRFLDGKVVESWDNWDTLGMFQQLGLEPKVVTKPAPGRTQPESRP